MRRSKIIVGVNCIAGAIITILVIMTSSFIVMLFSSADDGMRKSFFNTLYFDSTTNVDGSISMAFGLTGEYLPILLSIIFVFLFYYLTYIFYKKIQSYRQQLTVQKDNDE